MLQDKLNGRKNEIIKSIFWKSKMVVSPPLVFSINSKVGKETNKYYSQILEESAEKRDDPYSVIMSWI